MKTKVLFVEDDKVDQAAIARTARQENWPYDYAIAGSVVAAKKRLDSEKFDIVISDFMLGDGTAFDIFNSVSDAPFVVVTGGGNEEIAVEAIKAGASDYIVKETERRYLALLPGVIESTIKNFR